MTKISTTWTVLCASLMVGCGGGAAKQSASNTSEPQPRYVAQSTTHGNTDVTVTHDTTGSPVVDLPPSAPPSEAMDAKKAEAPKPMAMAARAEADVKSLDGKTDMGKVTLEQIGNKVTITAHFSGLKPGLHGFHIHENGDCGGPGAKNAGGHFNPTHAKHGPPESANRHVGDFGNVKADEGGNASFEMTTDSLTIGDGPDAVVGKAIVVHERKDDGKTQPSGASGTPIACGVIERRNVTDSTMK